jgi:tetratricopeptide (TPR) repeat protein
MTIESALQKIQQLLDDEQSEKATVVIAQSLVKLSQEPRAMLPILDGLDRDRKHTALLPIIAKLQEANILPLECAIFDMRMKFRTGDHGNALRIIDKILTISSDSIEALRTGGRIGNLTKDEDLALRHWERLAHVAASDPEAALQTARIYLRRAQHAQALEWAQRAAQQRSESTEPLQIAVSAGLEMGWPELCDPLLARLFAVDRARALKSLSRLVQELDCESAARVLSSLRQRYANDQAIADIMAKAYSQWLVAALEQELASSELDAARFYRAARSVQPGDPNAQRGLERLSMPSIHAMRDAFNSRDFPGTVEHGVMAARIDPDSFEAWQTVGRAQFTRSNFKDASDAFRRCTELNPKDAHSWLTYGLVLNQAGERRTALLAFQKARGVDDSEVKKEADASISALYPLLVRDAHQAAADGNIGLAWDSSDAALVIRPNDVGIIQLRRNLLRQQREQIREAWNVSSDSVASLCRHYLEKSPGDLYVSTVLGRTLMRTRAYAEALPIWENICAQNPEDSRNYLQVARCCRSLKIRNKGLIAAEKALRLDPELHEATEVADLLKALPATSN